MPIQLTQEDLEYLKNKGIDPSRVQPVDDDSQESPSSKSNGILPTIAKTAAAHAGGYLGGGAGLAAWGLAPFTEGLSLIPGAIGAAGAAMAGSVGGQKLQETLGGSGQEELEKSAEEASQEHPYIAGATDIAGSALAGGGSLSLKNLSSAGKQLLGRNALSDIDSLAMQHLGESALGTEGTEALAGQTEGKEALGKIFGSAILNPAINTGIDLATGQPVTPGGIASQVAGGALFSEQSRLGKFMSGHSATDEPLPETGSKDVTIQPTDNSLQGNTIYNAKDDAGNYKISDQLIKNQFLKDNLNTKAEMSKMTRDDALLAQQENMNHRANNDFDAMRLAMHTQALQAQDVNKPTDQSVGATTPSQPTSTEANVTDANKVAPQVEQANPAKPMTVPEYQASQSNEGDAQLQANRTAAQQAKIQSEVQAQTEGKTPTSSTDITSNQASETAARVSAVTDANNKLRNAMTSGEGILEAKSNLESAQQRLMYHLQEQARNAQPDVRASAESQVGKEEAIKAATIQKGIDDQAALQPARPPLNPDKNNMMRILNPKSIAESMQSGIKDTTGVHTFENLDNWLSSKKVDTDGKVYDAMQGIPIAIWNGSIDAIRLGVRAGKSIQEAVKDGIAHIKTHFKGDFDEKAYQDELMEGGLEYKQEGENGSPFKKVDTTNGDLPNKISIEQHIKSGNATTGSTLKIVSEGNSKWSQLAKRILEVSHPDKLNDKILSGWPEKRAAYHTDAKTGKAYIILNSKNLGDVSTIMHEAIHSVTSNNLPKQFKNSYGESLKYQMDKYLKSSFGDPHIKELIKCYYEAANQLGVSETLFSTDSQAGYPFTRGTAGNRDLTQRQIKNHTEHGAGTGYAMGNLHEFMAQLSNDDSFRNKLNKLNSGLNDGKSLWSRLVDGIRNLLGVPVNERSLLARTLSATEGIMGTERPRDYYTELHLSPNEEENKEVIPSISRMGKLGGLTEPIYDRIASLAHHGARTVADAFKLTDNTKDQYLGESWGKIKQVMDRVGFTKSDGEALDKISEWENLHHQKAPLSMFRTRAQRAVYNIERQVYDETGKRRIANNEPVYRNGKPTQLRQDPTAHPTPLAPKVAEMYKTGTDTDSIAKHDAEFVANAKAHGYSPDQAAKLLTDFKDTIQGKLSQGQTNMSFFGGSRLSQGVPLPKSFTKGGYATRLESYYKRMALDNAFYKHVESNPEVMSALGESKDAWGRPIPRDAQGGIANNDNVRTALKQFQGEATDTTSRTEGSITNLASTLFVSSPVIEMHKILSNTLNGALAIADNPVEAAKTFAHMITHMSDGIQHSIENGVTKMTAKSASDFFDSASTTAERFQALSQGWRNISSLGGRTDKWNNGLMQAGFESIIPSKIAKANRGDITSQQLLKKWDPSYTVGKGYSQKEVEQLSSVAAGYVHGTKDGRTMPPWMMKDTELSGFFKLAHWSVSQTNRFMSDVYTPATKGNMVPLVNALLGSAVGGYAIKQLREELQGKHGNIPDLKEISASAGGLPSNKNLVAYNLISALQYAGFAGILSQGIKTPVDWIYKNSPQGAVFPLDEIATDLVKNLGNLTTAAANDPNFNWADASMTLWNHILSTDVQLTRIGFNQGVNSGLITGMQADKKILSDKLGQLRRFDMVSGLPYDDQEPSQANPYMNIEQKKFKTEQDLPTAMKELPSLVQNIFQTYGDKPDVMLSKLKALKQNQYETFPSLEDKAPSFVKYMGYLEKLKGKEGADEDYKDFLMHKVINEAKASAVP